MNKLQLYKSIGIILLSLAIASSCQDSKRINDRVTLWRNDLIPYGTNYAFENLKYIFTDAEIVINKRSPDPNKGFVATESSNNASVIDYEEGNKAYIIITPMVDPDSEEIDAIFRMVSEGNHVFISALSISEQLLDSVNLSIEDYSAFYFQKDSLKINISDPVTKELHSFIYPGKAMDSYFHKMDSSITTIAGTDKQGRANFVQFSYEGGGTLSLHLAPLAFSNFFLLHKENHHYYELALSHVSSKSSKVYWDDYFRYNSRGSGNNQNEFSALGWVLKQDGLKEAIWLTVLLLLLIYLFESKRKQRIIPVIQPLKNASLDFVKTIGRLYLQRKDNRNLALKLKTHFLDQVRSRYNLQTSILDETFASRLSHKTGYDLHAMNQLIYAFQSAEEFTSMDDDELLSLNEQLENFQKHTA